MLSQKAQAFSDGPSLKSPHVLHPPTDARATRLDRFALAVLVRSLTGCPLRIRLWDGTEQAVPNSTPVGTIVIGDRRVLWRLITNTDLAFGEAYTDGRLEVEGDLVEVLTAISQGLAGSSSSVVRWPRRAGASLRAAARNAYVHYDLGNDFYEQWLDTDMVYTCAYYAEPDLTLEEAQRAKLDHVARKLALQPGEHVYEAGCGWGALALHLARHYGVTVRAWNVSHAQIAYARQRALDECLADRVEFVEGDYRLIDGRCDAFVSVGMLEHVGVAQYASLGRVIDRSLDRDHGRGLLHFIGRNAPAATSAWISRHIFPGTYLPSLSEVFEGVLEPHTFSILDVENLRRHYARTLAHWNVRYLRVTQTVAARFGERFARMWRLYLAEAQAGFRSGSLQLFQVTFARPRNDVMPLTRAALYVPGVRS